MSDKENEFEEHLDCTQIKIKILEENTFVLKKSLEEGEEKNELLTKQLAQKGMNISHPKSEIVCANKKGVELCIEAETSWPEKLYNSQQRGYHPNPKVL